MLPKIDVPIFSITLPSNGKKIRARPFLVKEEKILLMAARSGDPVDMAEATRQVITNCVLDEDIWAQRLPFFDIDYLFLALRAKSISETVDVNFSCNNIIGMERCGHIFPVTLDILNVELNKPKVSNTIMLDGKVGVKMQYPRYSEMRIINDGDKDILEKKLDMIKASIAYVFEGDKFYSLEKGEFDLTKLDEFIEGMTQAQFMKLEEWVDNFPHFEIVTQRKCEKCGFDHTVRYKNFNSFFH